MGIGGMHQAKELRQQGLVVQRIVLGHDQQESGLKLISKKYFNILKNKSFSK
jgi:ribosomal protein L25 (general stress protein Ctc)